MGRQPMEGDRGALGGAPVQHGLFFMIARIVPNQMPAGVGVATAQLAVGTEQMDEDVLRLSYAPAALRD